MNCFLSYVSFQVVNPRHYGMQIIHHETPKWIPLLCGHLCADGFISIRLIQEVVILDQKTEKWRVKSETHGS